jgi:hypothetical protein
MTGVDSCIRDVETTTRNGALRLQARISGLVYRYGNRRDASRLQLGKTLSKMSISRRPICRSSRQQVSCRSCRSKMCDVRHRRRTWYVRAGVTAGTGAASGGLYYGNGAGSKAVLAVPRGNDVRLSTYAIVHGWIMRWLIRFGTTSAFAIIPGARFWRICL